MKPHHGRSEHQPAEKRKIRPGQVAAAGEGEIRLLCDGSPVRGGDQAAADPSRGEGRGEREGDEPCSLRAEAQNPAVRGQERILVLALGASSDLIEAAEVVPALGAAFAPAGVDGAVLDAVRSGGDQRCKSEGDEKRREHGPVYEWCGERFVLRGVASEKAVEVMHALLAGRGISAV